MTTTSGEASALTAPGAPSSLPPVTNASTLPGALALPGPSALTVADPVPG
jgi:hypothetical protein